MAKETAGSREPAVEWAGREGRTDQLACFAWALPAQQVAQLWHCAHDWWVATAGAGLAVADPFFENSGPGPAVRSGDAASIRAMAATKRADGSLFMAGRLFSG